MDTSKLNDRKQITQFLPDNAIGIELGVAEGKFSKKLLETEKFAKLFGVDEYAGDRGHDDKQYNSALNLLSSFDNYKLIRKSFKEMLVDFPDEYFDFIYIDGYAHTGQNDGETLLDWYPKLKNGGIFSGDDYTERYPKNFDVVNNFIKKHCLELCIINDWNSHRTWFCVKN